MHRAQWRAGRRRTLQLSHRSRSFPSFRHPCRAHSAPETAQEHRTGNAASALSLGCRRRGATGPTGGPRLGGVPKHSLVTGLSNQLMVENEARRHRSSCLLYGWNLALPSCDLLLSSVLSFPPETAASERAEIIFIALDVASSRAPASARGAGAGAGMIPAPLGRNAAKAAATRRRHAPSARAGATSAKLPRTHIVFRTRGGGSDVYRSLRSPPWTFTRRLRANCTT